MRRSANQREAPRRRLVEIPNLEWELNGLLKQIPRGRVTTYGALASGLGHPPAAVWIAKSLMAGPVERSFRVVRASGEIPSHRSQIDQEVKQLLLNEGIKISSGRIDLEHYGFADFKSSRPLEKLKQHQQQLAENFDPRPLRSTPRRVAGLDLSYPIPDRAVAAAVQFEYPTGELLQTDFAYRNTVFPYITGLLAYREIEALIDVVEPVRSRGDQIDVWLVDGNGLLHPRAAGIAVHLGVMLGIATIGVAKTLLCGEVDLDACQPHAPQPIVYQGSVVGMAIKPNDRARPIFVSPGNGINLEQATEIVSTLCHDHRLPEPVYWADRLSRAHGQFLSRELKASQGH